MNNLYKKTYSRLEQYADYWHSKSVEFLDSAEILYNNLNNSPFCWNVYKMLAGLSFELLLKALCKQANIPFKNTHKLIQLFSLLDITLSEDELGILEILSEYIIWAGKYPIPSQDVHFPKLAKLESQYLNETIYKLGNIEIGTYNDKLNYPYILELWQKINNHYQIQSFT